MQLTPYLNFDGQCEAAFKHYAKVLDGKIEFISTWGASPMADQTPEGWADKIMHATLRIGDSVLMGADSPPGFYEKPQGTSISIHPKDVKQAERVFQALADGGEIKMPLQQTFWASRFGMLVDRYAIPWMVNCE